MALTLFGPITVQTGDTLPTFQPAVTADVLNVDENGVLTVVGALSSYVSPRFQDERNGEGSAEISLPRSAAAETALMKHGRFVRFYIKPRTVAIPPQARFTMKIEDWSKRVIDQGEEHDQLYTYRGRNWISYLAEAIVFPWSPTPAVPVGAFGAPGPRPFDDYRLFSFASPDYPENGAWITPTDQGPQSDPFLHEYRDFDGTPAPAGWPDGTSRWVGPNVANDHEAPPGKWYMRADVPLAEDTVMDIYATADDEFTFYVDGIALLADEVASRGRVAEQVPMQAGQHVVAMEVLQVPSDNIRAAVGNNVTGVNWTLISKNIANAGQPIWNSNTTTCRILQYPPQPPGFTAGRILTVLFFEAELRGAVKGVTASFDATVDSNGNAWEPIAEVSFPIGMNLMEAFLQLAHEAKIEVWMDPGNLRLHATQWKRRGGNMPVALHGYSTAPSAAVTNVTELTWETTITDIGTPEITGDE